MAQPVARYAPADLPWTFVFGRRRSELGAAMNGKGTL